MKPTIKEIEYIKEWTPRCRGNLPLFAEKMLGIELHKGQLRVIAEMQYKFYPTNLVLTGNRFGKTVMLAVKHIYKAFYKECGQGVNIDPDDWEHLEYVTIGLAPSTLNTQVMLRYIMQMVRGQFPVKKDGRIKKNESKIRYLIDLDGLRNYDKIPDQGPYTIKWANKSQSKFFTLGLTHGDSIQGSAFAYSSYDEFGRSKNPEKEIADILPRLIDFNGELDIITTPDIENELAVSYILQKQEEAKAGSQEVRLIRGNTEENPHIPTEDLKKRLSGQSEDKQRQILYGDITLLGANYFDIEAVNEVFKPHFLSQPFRGAEIYVGLDTAGSGNDYWALTFICTSTSPWQVLETYYDKKNQPATNLAITMNKLNNYIKYYGRDKVTLVMDYTNEAGSIYYGDLKEYSPIKYRFGTQKLTGKSTKAELTDTLRRVLNEKLIKCKENIMLKHQLLMYKGPSDDEKLVTDALMSIALAVYYPYKAHLNNLNGYVTDLD